MFTMPELKRLHRRFGYPNADKLFHLLKRAEPDKVEDKTRSRLEEIVQHCKLCQFHAQKPRRFKFTLQDEKNFNQVSFLDIVSIDQKNAIHVADEATRYQAARWLPTMGADSVWLALLMCWIDV